MPLKRNEALVPVSRDHHFALLLCFKIRTGFSKGVPAERIKKYSDWFYRHHIMPHFELEEKYLFPVLGNDHPLIQQALHEHSVLLELFTNGQTGEDSLRQIADVLEKHIRFEERTLFGEIEKHATKEQLGKIREMHTDESFADNVTDEFWK